MNTAQLHLIETLARAGGEYTRQEIWTQLDISIPVKDLTKLCVDGQIEVRMVNKKDGSFYYMYRLRNEKT